MSSRAFFAYPSFPPSLSETIRVAAERIEKLSLAEVRLWEDLKVGGKIIIDTITEAILASDVSCFESSGLNKNVMFELGFAIGADRKVWLMFDETDAIAKRNWDQLRTLTTVGYVPYKSSQEIVDGFTRERPFEPDVTIFQKAIEPSLLPVKEAAFFYVLSNHPTEASRQLTRLIRNRTKSRGVRLIQADPTESSIYPITWYAQQIYTSQATLIHFAGERRKDADVHNARCALIAGLAHGMRRPVLMLSEGDVLAPIDYRDLLKPYVSASDCVAKARDWVEERVRTVAIEDVQAKRAAALRLATELKSVRLGEVVAENEEEQLGDYFVETASYREVLLANTTVFVGRKGTGKTANLFRAAAELGSDKRNLVCVVKPSSYELEAVTRLLSRYSTRDVKGYLVSALWQYLLYTEIALTLADEVRARPAGPMPDSPEGRLIRYIDESPPEFSEDFAVRLEKAVESLLALELGDEDVAKGRLLILEHLHDSYLRTLREKLIEALAGRERVAILIDNLDKAWDREKDLDQLALLLLGLLTAVGPVSQTFSKGGSRRRPVRVTLAVFLRSDIFSRVIRVAREPDKIPITRIAWENPDLLLRVVEERYRAPRGDEVDSKELWEKFFEPTVSGLPIPDYITQRILPRPRDIVYFCNAAITNAINAGHNTVTEIDIRSAEKAYSQFAIEALRVENGITLEQFEDVIFEFVGGLPILSKKEVEATIERAGIPKSKVEAVIDQLTLLAFFGVEAREGEFRYCEEEDELSKVKVLGQKLERETGSSARINIHPAFRPYLEVIENGG